MAKRQRFLTESEISKIMNEPDSELSSDESINSLCFTDSNDSEMTEEYDVNDPINAPRVSEWNSNISDLPNLNFSSDCGAKINSSNPLEKEVDYFNLFFSQDIIDLIVEQTNKFAAFELEKDAQKPSTSSAKSKSFANITINELRVFFALVLLMSIIRKPSIKLYFSTNPMFATPFFNNVMARNRFLAILRYLHFSDTGSKKFEKVKPVIDLLIQKFKCLYVPERNISVDESLLAWKGRLGFRQYIPSKRARYGIKIYKLCESSTGYIWNALVGKDTEMSETTGLYGERVVKSLMSGLLGKGYNLYLDRFFVSPDLAAHLLSNATNVCGTVNRFRRGMP